MLSSLFNQKSMNPDSIPVHIVIIFSDMAVACLTLSRKLAGSDIPGVQNSFRWILLSLKNKGFLQQQTF